MTKWVDVSTIIAAAAGLWALSFAWLTYVMSIKQQNRDRFLALRSIVQGLRVELEVMKPWTGAGGQGYSKKMKRNDAPPDWSQPSRLIWKFSYEAISNLSNSAYLYALGSIVEPFARLNFSISRLFQLYDEYRTFVNSHTTLTDELLDVRLAIPAAKTTWKHDKYQATILDFNFQMHVNLIGGVDSDDPACLYKAYDAATSALDEFEVALRERTLPLWFRAGHAVSVACLASGGFLLFRLFRP